MHSVQNSNTFLSYYNQIDKFFAYVLQLKRYIPFGEKISVLGGGDFSISAIVHRYETKLRYFGDMRNQLVHGFRIDKRHYVVASDHAVQQIQSLYEEMRHPKTVVDAYQRKVYTCRLEDSLEEVIDTMKAELYTHVPVYDKKGKFVEMLSESTIAYRLGDKFDQTDHIDLDGLSVKDVPLENSNDQFLFVDKSTSVYDIEQYFLKYASNHKRLGAIFVTENGQQDQPII
jgi:predicted transcriptional regulator